MSLDLLDIEPDPIAPALELEPDSASAALALAPAPGLVEVLGADVRLPDLMKWVPDQALRTAAVEAAHYALGLDVVGAEELERADLALTALRASQKAILTSFADPVGILDQAHKRLTSMRGDWLGEGERAVKTVGTRIATEQKRLDDEAAAARRQEQEEANRKERERLAAEADRATKQRAPAPVVEALKQQAQTATAPPVQSRQAAPAMKGNTVTSTWKSRTVNTPVEAEPVNPEIGEMSPAQLEDVKDLLAAILAGTAPIGAIAVNWSYLNLRAKADKSTFSVPGFVAFESLGVRAKAVR
jgi:hypothetical protein